MAPGTVQTNSTIGKLSFIEIFFILQPNALLSDGVVKGMKGHWISGVQMTVEKTNTKVIIPTNHNRRKQLDEPMKIPSNYGTYNLLKAREKSHAQGGLVFVLLFIGRKSGARLLSQTLSVAIADEELLSTIIWKLLSNAIYKDC